MCLQVVLDLDETLVCAYETSSLPAALRNQAIEAGLKWFELECLSTDKVSFRTCSSQVNSLFVDFLYHDISHSFLLRNMMGSLRSIMSRCLSVLDCTSS